MNDQRDNQYNQYQAYANQQRQMREQQQAAQQDAIQRSKNNKLVTHVAELLLFFFIALYVFIIYAVYNLPLDFLWGLGLSVVDLVFIFFLLLILIVVNPD